MVDLSFQELSTQVMQLQAQAYCFSGPFMAGTTAMQSLHAFQLETMGFPS